MLTVGVIVCSSVAPNAHARSREDFLADFYNSNMYYIGTIISAAAFLTTALASIYGESNLNHTCQLGSSR